MIIDFISDPVVQLFGFPALCALVYLGLDSLAKQRKREDDAKTTWDPQEAALAAAFARLEAELAKKVAK